MVPRWPTSLTRKLDANLVRGMSPLPIQVLVMFELCLQPSCHDTPALCARGALHVLRAVLVWPSRQLRQGGPGLRATQAYPIGFGKKLAALALEAGAGKLQLLSAASDAEIDELMSLPQLSCDPWLDADMLPIHGFLSRMF